VKMQTDMNANVVSDELHNSTVVQNNGQTTTSADHANVLNNPETAETSAISQEVGTIRSKPIEDSVKGSTEESSPKVDFTIVDEVMDFVNKFVFLNSGPVSLLVALWIIGTYLHKRFDYFGYLFAHSPEPQSGKTTLLEVLDLLGANSG